VALGGQALGEVPVPPLGATDGVGALAQLMTTFATTSLTSWLATVVLVIRRCVDHATGKSSDDVRYFLSSLPAKVKMTDAGAVVIDKR